MNFSFLKSSQNLCILIAYYGGLEISDIADGRYIYMKTFGKS